MIIHYSELTMMKSFYPKGYAARFNEPKVTHVYVESGQCEAVDTLDYNNGIVMVPGSLVRIVHNIVNANGSKTVGLLHEDSVFYCIGPWVYGEPGYIETLQCDGTMVLKPKTFALVMDGCVEFFDEKLIKAEKLNLIKQRKHDIELSGNARLIVFRY